ncbi:MAG: hypothetical protein ACYCYF_00455 [Anaerolineae bacterium]
MTVRPVHLRKLFLATAFLLLLCVPVALVRGDGAVVVDSITHVTAPLADPVADDVLLVQATYVPASVPRYIVTLTNLSPWTLGELRILDRFFAPESDEEQSAEWTLDGLAPGESASHVFIYENLDPPACCHQIEMNWSENWSAFVVDQGEGSRTSIWSMALTAEMAVAEDEPLSFESPVGRSKLGLHVTRNSAPEIMAFIEAAQPAVLVGVGDLGWLAEAKELSPGSIILGRFEETAQTMTGDPAVRAQEFVVGHAARYLANPGVDYWLGWNEPGIDSTWQMEWYAAFEAERARLMSDLGLKVAVGNFSTGTPEADEFASFLPAIETAKALGGVLAVHEYSAPTMMDGVGLAIPGHEAEVDAGSLTLRYRYWYEHYLAPARLVIPLVVTEAGIDSGVLPVQAPAVGGWRDLDATSAGQALSSYVGQLSWYDDQLRRDPYVIGFAVFNAGDANGRWASFDITPELGTIAEMTQDKD